jgi:hypothetical protein
MYVGMYLLFIRYICVRTNKIGDISRLCICDNRQLSLVDLISSRISLKGYHFVLEHTEICVNSSTIGHSQFQGLLAASSAIRHFLARIHQVL